VGTLDILLPVGILLPAGMLGMVGLLVLLLGRNWPGEYRQ
jgi:hypothetical protein